MIPKCRALIAIFIAVPLLGSTELPGPPTGRQVAGHCQYADTLANYAAETTFINCDTLIVRDAPKAMTLDFVRREKCTATRFYGKINKGRILVDRISLNNARPQAARGSCNLSYRFDGTLGNAACLAELRGRWIAANFVPSRLDPPQP